MHDTFASQDNHNKIAIVAGNGPSLAEIDYTRLPPPPKTAESRLDSSPFDVFRCNQFYFEEEYFLGKKVKYAFAIPQVLFEQVYTLRTLHYKGEYNIANIVVSSFGLNHLDSLFYRHRDLFKNILNGVDTLQILREFFTFITHNDIYHDRRITSGVYMCAFAIALGYREIYLAGIDLYSTSSVYAFDTLKPNLSAIVPQTSAREMHFPETDLEALAFLAKHYGARFYCLCPSSPLAKHIPLAPVRENCDVQGWEQVKQPKPADATRDMLIPPIGAYKKLYRNPPSPPITRLHNNFLYRFFYDIVRFPSHIKHYIRAKKRYKSTTKERPNG